MEFVKDVPLAELRTYHRNPRRGDVEAIKTSILANGVYKPLVVNRGTHTGRSSEVLAGNHLMKALRDLGRDSADVVFVDVDDDQAARIVLADNRASDLGSYEIESLIELIQSVDDLEGTLYTDEELSGLLAADDTDADADTDADTDADAGEGAGTTTYGVVVMCASERDQLALLNELLERGLPARALSG